MDGTSKPTPRRCTGGRSKPKAKTGKPDPGDTPALQLSQRVTYDVAARMLCVSPDQLTALISSGELAVIQPAKGRRVGLIEVAALQDLLDRWRATARRAATARAKSCAGKKGARRGRS